MKIHDLISALSLTLVAGVSQAAPVYSVISLSTIDSPFAGLRFNPSGVNNRGEVVGSISVPVSNTFKDQAVLYSDGRFTTIGKGTESATGGINNSGEVVGTNVSSNRQAFLYSGGATSEIAALVAYGAVSATAINDRGDIVGDSVNGGFLYADGDISNLGTLGGRSGYPRAINNRGEVVGIADIPGSIFSHGFLYRDGNMIDLGSLGTRGSYGRDINDEGEVIINAYYGGLGPGAIRRSFLYTADSTIDLGNLGGSDVEAEGINNRGQIVGYSSTTQFGERTGFLYTNGKMIDLDSLVTPGWNIGRAYDISDSGYIAAFGCDVQARCGGLLLVPITIPEPQSLGLVFAGMILIVTLARRTELVVPI
jgi:probable HAF family extracellular repeat protein